MAMLKFLKGAYGNLGNAAISEGQILVTNDTHELFVDVSATERIKIGDFITVANLTALEALDATNVPTTRLYYVEDGNILARSNGTAWIQVNKQKTADELKTFLGLGSMAYKSEVAEDDLNADLKAKVNAASEGNHSHANKALLDTYTQTEANLADAVAKKHEHANKAELDKIAEGDKAKWDAVAADHLTSADKTTLENAIKEAKKAGTDANTALETYKVSNDARVLAVEEDVAEITNAENGILAQAKSYADGKDSAIAAAKKAGDDAQADITAYKTSNDAAVAAVKATADAAAVQTEVETALAGKVDKVEGKSLISDTEIARLANVTNYDDTQVKADIAKKADADTMTTELGKKVDKVDGYSLVSDTEIARLADVDNYDDTEVRGLISDNADAIAAIEADYLKAADKYDDTALSERVKAIEDDYLKTADKTELTNAINAEKERAEGIESGLRTDVDAIKGDYLKVSDKTALQDQITANANAIELLTNGVSADEVDGVNDLIQYVKDHGTEVTGMKADIAANTQAITDQATADAATYETKTDASAKLTEAKEYAGGLNTAMDTRVKALEEIDHDAYIDADSALKTEVNGYADEKVKALADGAVAANTAAIATKADASKVYTKEEVDAAVEAAVTEANTWGSF